MWSSNGVNVYDEDGEWVADCRVPSIYSQAQVEALAKQIAEDHNTVAQLRKLLGEARKGLEAGGNAAFATSMWVESGDNAGDGFGWREVERRIRVTITDIDAALAEKEVGE